MLILPIETEDHSHDALIIVLEKDNLDRMKQADPAEVDLRKSGKTLVNPVVMVCYEEEQAKLTMVHQGNLEAIIKHLQRGWRFSPDKGDHDRGLESIKDQN